MNRNTCYEALIKYCVNTEYEAIKSDKDVGLTYIIKQGNTRERLIQIFFRPEKVSILIAKEVKEFVEKTVKLPLKVNKIGKRYNYENISDSIALKICDTYINGIIH